MSVVGFEIDAEEWETLAEVTRRLLPSEPARVPGVVLEVGAERRRWTVQTPWLQVRLDGGAEAERPVAPVCVPTRLVAHASELAGMVGSCRLEVAERSLVVVNEVGSARFGAPGGVHLVRDPWAGRVVDARDAVAVVPVDQLVGALRSACQLPSGVELCRRTGPDLWLAVSEGHVELSVDWSRFGAAAVAVRVPGEVTGSGTARAPHVELAELLGALEEEGDVRLELDEARQVLWLEGPFWQAVLAVGHLGAPPSVAGGRRGATTAGRREVEASPVAGRGGPPTVEGALALLGDGPAGADGSRTVTVGGVVVKVGEAVDGSGAVRAVVRLADGVDDTAEALGEVNALNAGLVGVRVWMADAAVWAGVDVERAQLATLDRAIRQLVRRTADLGLLVAMLGLSGGLRPCPGQLSLIDDA